MFLIRSNRNRRVYDSLPSALYWYILNEYNRTTSQGEYRNIYHLSLHLALQPLRNTSVDRKSHQLQ